MKIQSSSPDSGRAEGPHKKQGSDAPGATSRRESSQNAATPGDTVSHSQLRHLLELTAQGSEPKRRTATLEELSSLFAAGRYEPNIDVVTDALIDEALSQSNGS